MISKDKINEMIEYLLVTITEGEKDGKHLDEESIKILNGALITLQWVTESEVSGGSLIDDLGY